MFKKILFSITTIVLLTTQVVHAEVVNVSNWSTIADVAHMNGVVGTSSEWFAAELPGEIIKKSLKTNLDDIRLVDSTNTEIPYIVVRQGDVAVLPESADTAEGREVKVLENSLIKGAQGQDRIMVLEIPVEGRIYNGIILSINPQSTNFRKVVHVAVSDVQLGATSPSWRELEAKPVIYNYSDKQSLFVQKSDVDFVAASSRYIRLRFEQDPALAGTGVQFANNVLVDGARVMYESGTTEKGPTIKNYLAGTWTSASSVTETALVDTVKDNAETKSAEVVYKSNSTTGFVGANKISIKVDKDETNFKRQITVMAGVQDGTDVVWKTVGAGQIYRIKSPVFQGESTSITFPATSANYFKVIIQNNNDKPLKLENVATIDLSRTALIFKTNNQDLTGVKLIVGNSVVSAPTYELQKTITYFETVSPVRSVVQNIKDNPLFKVTPDNTPFGEKYKWMLNVALVVFVLLIVVLGWKWRGKSEVSNLSQNGITDPGDEN